MLKIVLFSFVIVFLLCSIQAARIRAEENRPKSGVPYISIYEHENHRGRVYHQPLKKECSNFPAEYDDWASSMVSHDRCVTLCDHKNCLGECVAIYPNNKGPKRLKDFSMNDRASSLKYCYTG